MPVPWVVKLGGSLYGSGNLPLWLEALAAANAVIVPGGGPFADQVRAAQARWRFGNEAAHNMAVLAMAQYGLMLAGLCPALRTASDPDAMRAAVRRGYSAVWLPDPGQLPEAQVPPSWDVTSDSLAAWLSGRLGARRLLLVKSAAVPGPDVRAELLAVEGIVDGAFPGFLEAGTCEAWIAGPEYPARLAEGLRHPGHRFTKLLPGP